MDAVYGSYDGAGVGMSRYPFWTEYLFFCACVLAAFVAFMLVGTGVAVLLGVE